MSHINYGKVEIKKENVQDTIFLIPTSVLLNEVVVNKRQPKWINAVLSRVIKGKGKNYQTLEKTFSYKYETYTLTDSNGYEFKSKGNIEFPKMKKDVQFKIDAQSNTIKYKNKTAGVDFSNLRRMLYDDFVNGYFIANLSLSKTFYTKFNLQIGANNLFHFTNPKEISNIPGRQIFGKIQFNL